MSELLIFGAFLLMMGLGTLVQEFIDYMDGVKLARLRSHKEFVRRHPHLYQK